MEKRNLGKLITGIIVIVFVFIAALMFGLPRYNVWQQEMAGKAEMAKAEQNRRILVEEAKAKLEAEKLILDKQWNNILYRNIMEKQENVEIIKLKLIPYFCAFNRGENEMAIWLKTK